VSHVALLLSFGGTRGAVGCGHLIYEYLHVFRVLPPDVPVKVRQSNPFFAIYFYLHIPLLYFVSLDTLPKGKEKETRLEIKSDLSHVLFI
jgi:hypothetical protein